MLFSLQSRSVRICEARVLTTRKIYFTEVMPKTATGKIQRRIVAETMQKQETKAKL